MVLIKIKQGELLGQSEISCTGKKYYSFKGVPYAKPPLGDLRFRVLFYNTTLLKPHI